MGGDLHALKRTVRRCLLLYVHYVTYTLTRVPRTKMVGRVRQCVCHVSLPPIPPPFQINTHTHRHIQTHTCTRTDTCAHTSTICSNPSRWWSRRKGPLCFWILLLLTPVPLQKGEPGILLLIQKLGNQNGGDPSLRRALGFREVN